MAEKQIFRAQAFTHLEKPTWIWFSTICHTAHKNRAGISNTSFRTCHSPCYRKRETVRLCWTLHCSERWVMCRLMTRWRKTKENHSILSLCELKTPPFNLFWAYVEVKLVQMSNNVVGLYRSCQRPKLGGRWVRSQWSEKILLEQDCWGYDRKLGWLKRTLAMWLHLRSFPCVTESGPR